METQLALNIPSVWVWGRGGGVCSLSCPVCKARQSYYVFCDLSGTNIYFLHCVMKGMILEKKNIEEKHLF